MRNIPGCMYCIIIWKIYKYNVFNKQKYVSYEDIEQNEAEYRTLWYTRSKYVKNTLNVIYFYILTYLCFNYEYTIVTASSDKPYIWTFAISKSWRIQSKALQRFIRTSPTKFLSSINFLQFSVSLNKTWFELEGFLSTSWLEFWYYFSIRRKAIVRKSFINFRHSI